MSMSFYLTDELTRRRRQLGIGNGGRRRLGIESFDIRDLDPCKPIMLIFGRSKSTENTPKTFEETIHEMLINNQSDIPSCDTLNENNLEWQKNNCTLIDFNDTTVTCGYVFFFFFFFF